MCGVSGRVCGGPSVVRMGPPISRLSPLWFAFHISFDCDKNECTQQFIPLSSHGQLKRLIQPFIVNIAAYKSNEIIL